MAAMILLAEAATAFTPARTGRLAAGAEVIRPVATAEPPPFEFLGGTTPIRKNRAVGARPTSGTLAAPDPQTLTRPAAPREIVATPID